MIKKVSLLLLLSTIFVTQIIVAQSIKKSSGNLSSNWEINYNIGFSQFYGDASNSSFFQKFSGEIGIGNSLHLKKHLSPVFALGLNGYYGCVKSHKTLSGSGSTVDFLLGGNYGDINLRAYVNFNSLFWGYDKNRRISVYGWLGLGYGFWSTGLTDNISGDYRESGSAVSGTTETYKKGGGVVPIGFGVDYRISNHWSANVVGDFRTVLNDDLDVWRGGFKFDQMFFIGIGVSYHINSGFGKRKSRSKTKKAPSRKIQAEDAKVEAFKSGPVKPSKKIISDVPIYELDYNSRRISGGNVSQRPATTDVLKVVPSSKPMVMGIVYRVQILAKSSRLPDINYLRNRYNLNEDIFEVKQDGIYRYSVGTFSTYSQAVEYNRVLKNKGVHDAFVTVYKDGKRIALTSELKR